MTEYKEMYLKMMRAAEEAINILIKAQQECENMYICAGSGSKSDLPCETRTSAE